MSDSTYVVIAEPSELVRSLLEYVVVNKLCWKADATASGLQALELIQRHHPDVVIAENYLNDLGGLELCRQMREDPGLSHIPVVWTSVWSREARDAGAAASRLKPFSLSDLMGTLARVFDERPRPYTNGRPSREERVPRFVPVWGRPTCKMSMPPQT